MLQVKSGVRWLRGAEFRGGEPLRRIEHVGRRRILSGRRVTPANGFDDHAVLIADLSHELKTARLIRTCHTPCCRENCVRKWSVFRKNGLPVACAIAR
jgi:hypothetical protein